TRYFAWRMGWRVRGVEGPIGFPPLTVMLLDDANRVVYPPKGAATAPFVDERMFQLVFFDPALVPFEAPQTRKPEVWRIRTGYGGQTIPAIIDGRARPQRALMAMLAGVLALGVFFVVRAAARE